MKKSEHTAISSTESNISSCSTSRLKTLRERRGKNRQQRRVIDTLPIFNIMEHFLPWHCKLCDSFEDTSQSAACPKTVSTIWLLLSWKLPAHMFHQMSYSKQQTMHSHPLLTPPLIYQCGRALHPPSLLMWKLRGICCLPGNGKRLEVHAMTKMNLWYWLVDAADQMQSQSLSLNLLSAAAVDDVGHKTLQVKIQQTYSSALNVTWLTELKLCIETSAPCHLHLIHIKFVYKQNI